MSKHESLPQTQEDSPLFFAERRLPVENRFDVTSLVKGRLNRDDYNTVKGHHLLGWCVGLIVFIYLFELFKNGGQTSPVGEQIIEILKLLIFSLSGYLFGTNSGKRD